MFTGCVATARALIGAVLLFVWSLSQAAVGRIEGAGGVSSNGAATYEIPLRLPPGPDGIQPQLSLVYDSQRGNGILGPGWALAGLPAITRCNRTFAQDGISLQVTLTYSDAFCLDGQRLRITNAPASSYGQAGTTYDTEIAAFSQITAFGTAGNGPAYFILKAKSGLIFEFGATPDSRVTPSPTSSTAHVWLLSKVRNRSGTSFTITYGTGAAGSTGIGVPQTISYAPSSGGSSSYTNTITFTYGAKASQMPGTMDPAEVGFVGGVQVVNTNLLLAIEARISGTLSRKYTLAYEAAPTTVRSRLASITECAGSAGTDCLAPTTISYQNGTAGVSSAVSVISGTSINVLGAADFNLDGREDIVYVNGGTLNVVFATPTGVGSPVAVASSASAANVVYSRTATGTGAASLLIAQSGTYSLFTWNGSSFVSTSLGAIPANTNRSVLMDVNGDGRDDLVSITKTVINGPIPSVPKRYVVTPLVRFSTSAGGAIGFSAAVASASFEHFCADGPSCDVSIIAGFSGRPLDFNGDARHDLALFTIREVADGGSPIIEQESYLLFANGSGFTTFTTTVPTFGFSYGRWNDDACTDRTSAGTIYISACNDQAGATIALPLPAVGIMDWNGDGQSDVLVKNGSNFGVIQSTGTGMATLVTTTIPYGIPFIFDQDGDGQDDLGVWSLTGISFYPHNAVGAPPDLATSITDGYGVAFNPSYVSMARDNYEPGSGAVYPELDFIAPMYVVSSFTASTGASAAGSGSTFTQSLRYYRARAHAQGRGFLGFDAIRRQDSRNGLYVYEYYNRSFPYTGTRRQTDVVQSNNTTLISRTQNTWTTHTYGTAPEIRFLPYASSSSSQQYEVGGEFNGVLVSSSSTSRIVDSMTGTLKDSTTTLTEGSTANGLNPGQSYTFRTYSPTLFNDFSQWCFGRPTSTQQINSHSGYGGAEQTRTADTTWDPVFCRPTQSVIEPGNSTRQVTTDLAYDEFGNLATQTVTPIGQSERVTQLGWGADGKFPRTLTNALSQVSTLTWWDELGLLRNSTDPNGLTSMRFYDNFGRLVTQVHPDSTSTQIEYLACDSDCVGFTGAKYKIRSTLRDTSVGTIARGFTVMDGFDRPRRSGSYALEGGLITRLTEYDVLGRVARSSTPYFHFTGVPVWTAFTYDELGRQRQATRERTSDNDTSASTSTVQFDGLSILSTDPQGKVRVDVFDPLGQVVRAIQASGTVDQSPTRYDYDAFASLVRTTDGAGNEILIGYDVRGFKISSSDPDLGNWTYDYFPAGELKTQTDAKSQTVTFTYDKLSRPLTREELADSGSGMQTTQWTWGASATSFNIGQLQSIAVGSYSESYSYDNRSRLSSTTVVADGGTYVLSQSYNATTGFLETVTYPASTGAAPFKVKYEFDTANQSGLLRTVRDFNAGTVFWEAVSSNALGQYQDVTLGNGLKTLTAFDSITGVTNRIETGPNGGNSRQHLQYNWDKLGNLTSREDLNIAKTEDFTYDNLYRLIEAQVSGSTALTVAYNELGNITSKSDLGSYSYHPTKKHAVVSAGPLTFTYDPNGNIATQVGAGRNSTVQWTAYNLPKLISDVAGFSSTFLYGPDRQRYKQVANSPGISEATIYVKGLFEKLTRSAGVEYKHSIFGPDGVVAVHIRKSSGVNETIYLLKDHLGSTDVITSSTGASLLKLSYGPFGERRDGNTWSGPAPLADYATLGNTTRISFTGHEYLDNLDLVHMNGRVYHPLIARFGSPDPFVQAPFNSQSLNRYSYVFNNPLSFTDPSGFAGCIVSGSTTTSADGGGATEDCRVRPIVLPFDNPGGLFPRPGPPCEECGAVGLPFVPRRPQPNSPTELTRLPAPVVLSTSQTVPVSGIVGSTVGGRRLFPSDTEGAFTTGIGDGIAVPTFSPGLTQARGDVIQESTATGVFLGTPLPPILTGIKSLATAVRLRFLLRGFSAAERSIALEARAILQSSEFATIRAAQAAGRAAEVKIAGRTVVFEPGAPVSGMTLFGENGFIIGREAFRSEAELAKTLLQELFRLNRSQIGPAGAASQAAVTAETNAAFSFAERAFNALFQ